ncbi:hypothetical protein IU433_12335 [Nocardia puris]|uniref:Uncharacterized protein n=1 Tax=Nocardia puris TaxID=208602 RepID=A0A366CWQ7_9NOCA|nr:hypothetical protein [Nocardia puris]MBF6368399.1 hypothetical protein [Nocardia puris]MBF6459825.1 hypothetical protein [Nocardia puris]RBO82096.1 hypothetical protein DFR74_12551 [Nocardia puris]
MADTSPAPRRAYHAEITIGADTLTDLIYELEDLANRLRDGYTSGDLLSGSPSSGAVARIAHNPDMTHDRYMADTLAWLRRGDETP